MKQAILVWSFRQNIILGSFLQKSSFSTHGGAAVVTIIKPRWFDKVKVK